MAYRVLRTAKAESEIRDIILYREQLTGSTASALELMNKLEAELKRLSDFPEIGARPRYASLRQRGYRVLIVEKYLIFYKIYTDEKTVIIYAVVDGRRDYLNLI